MIVSHSGLGAFDTFTGGDPMGILVGKDWKGLACATTRVILSIGAKGADPSKLKI